jgi:hypothetical protein
MAQILSLSLTTKVVLTAVWLALTFALLLILVPKGHDVATARIVIVLNDDLQKLNLKFWLLHVRDGKDEVRDAGPLLNEEIAFRPVDRRGTMEATVRYAKSLGLQFKCFAEQGNHTFETVETRLKDNGFVEISKGVGPKFRVFFILTEHPTYTTVDKFLNNYYYPS